MVFYCEFLENLVQKIKVIFLHARVNI